jgi:hypothetical protein
MVQESIFEKLMDGRHISVNERIPNLIGIFKPIVFVIFETVRRCPV